MRLGRKWCERSASDACPVETRQDPVDPSVDLRRVLRMFSGGGNAEEDDGCGTEPAEAACRPLVIFRPAQLIAATGAAAELDRARPTWSRRHQRRRRRGARSRARIGRPPRRWPPRRRAAGRARAPCSALSDVRGGQPASRADVRRRRRARRRCPSARESLSRRAERLGGRCRHRRRGDLLVRVRGTCRDGWASSREDSTSATDLGKRAAPSRYRAPSIHPAPSREHIRTATNVSASRGASISSSLSAQGTAERVERRNRTRGASPPTWTARRRFRRAPPPPRARATPARHGSSTRSALSDCRRTGRELRHLLCEEVHQRRAPEPASAAIAASWLRRLRPSPPW